MVQFITEYWLKWLFGLIIAGLGFLCRRFYKLYLSEKNHQKTKEQEEFYQGLKDQIKESVEHSKQDDKVLQDQIDILKTGILSIQRRTFKQECRELLREDHKITLAEFETIQDEHNTYHALGGNGNGDALYEMVCKKATNDITDKNAKIGNP